MIYALLLRNFGVEIHALFPQNILDWGADSANFSSFWMYEDQESKSNGVSLQSRLNPAGCALSSAINAMMDWLLSFQRLQCLSRMVESCSKTRWVSIFTSGSNSRFSRLWVMICPCRDQLASPPTNHFSSLSFTRKSALLGRYKILWCQQLSQKLGTLDTVSPFNSVTYEKKVTPSDRPCRWS